MSAALSAAVIAGTTTAIHEASYDTQHSDDDAPLHFARPANSQTQFTRHNTSSLSVLHLLPLCHYLPTLIPLTQLTSSASPFFYTVLFISGLVGVPNISILLSYVTCNAAGLTPHQASKRISWIIIAASCLNFLYCLGMLAISIWYSGNATPQTPNFHGDVIVDSPTTMPLPWWAIFVAMSGCVSGPVMELIVRLELMRWEKALQTNASVDSTSAPRARSNIDAIMRIGLILAWTIAVLGGYWAACVVALFGLILSCSWQHSWATMDQIEWSRLQGPHADDWDGNGGTSAAGRVGRSTQRQRSSQQQQDDEGNTTANSEQQHWDDEPPSDEPLIQYSTSQSNNVPPLLSTPPTSFFMDFIRTNTFFYLLEFISLTIAYFAFLRLSSLFMTSTITDFGFSFRWYDMSVVNGAAGCAVLVYLLLVHKPLMQTLTENQVLIVGTVLGFVCIVPLPLLYYFAREKGTKSYFLWQFLIILIPAYHISITLGILSIRRKLTNSVHDYNHTYIVVIMFMLTCIGMALGVLFGSTMYQVLKYFRKPQIASFVAVALLHVIVVLLNMSRACVECITPLESERAIMFDFGADDLSDSDEDVDELFSRPTNDMHAPGDVSHEEGHFGALESAEDVSDEDVADEGETRHEETLIGFE